MTSNLVDAQHPATLLSNVHYNQFGAVTDSLGNGLSETMGYSARGIPQSYSATPYAFSLGLAANGAITSGNDSVNGNWTYGYDQFNRLVSSNKNTGAQTFSYVYDRNGNRLQQNAPQGGPAPQYLFDNNNRISGSGVTYDALGNILADGLGNTFTYDAESRLIKVVNSGGTYTYTYDADGRRIKNNSSEFVYDLAGRAVALFGATSGVWNYGEIYAGGRHVATYSNSTTTFLHTDWLGSKRVVSSLTGTTSQSCTSLPFGDGVSCTGTASTFNGFTDDIHDSESNLENTWFRQLSGTQGRWTSPDPYLGSMDIGNPQSMNRYAYVENRPLMFVDSAGLEGGPPAMMCSFDNFFAFGSFCDLLYDKSLLYSGGGGGTNSQIGKQLPVAGASRCDSLPPGGGTIRVSMNSPSVPSDVTDFSDPTMTFQFDGNGSLVGLGFPVTTTGPFATDSVSIPADTYTGYSLSPSGAITFGFNKPVNFGNPTGSMANVYFSSATFYNGRFTAATGAWAPNGMSLGSMTGNSDLILAALNGNLPFTSSLSSKAVNLANQLSGVAQLLKMVFNCKSLFGG